MYEVAIALIGAISTILTTWLKRKYDKQVQKKKESKNSRL